MPGAEEAKGMAFQKASGSAVDGEELSWLPCVFRFLSFLLAAGTRDPEKWDLLIAESSAPASRAGLAHGRSSCHCIRVQLVMDHHSLQGGRCTLNG